MSLTALAGSMIGFDAVAEERDRREVPDYDGREPPPATTTDVLLWVPRVVLFPAYVVSEYVIRWPLGTLIAGAERAGVPGFLYDVFAFGPDHKAGVVPTAFVQFGFQPSVGLYAFWDDAFFDGHDLRLRGAISGNDWLSLGFSERFHYSADDADQIKLEAALLRRPDYAFFGLGPDTRQDDIARFGMETRDLRFKLEERIWRFSRLETQIQFRKVSFRSGVSDDDILLDEALAQGRFPTPPGYPEGYTIVQNKLRAVVDNRLPRPAPGTGVRVEVEARHSSDLEQRGSFIWYGARAAGFLDLNERQRVLSLSASTRFVDPIDEAVIPFPEQVRLGGTDPMVGFFEGRLVDRSAAVAELAYHWPIWIWLDGALRFEVGNVFGEHLEGFELEKLRYSAALGIESTNARDAAFQFLFGVGSEPFEDGGSIDSVRLAVGTTHGF